MKKIKSALLSVSDKSNLKPLLQILKNYNIKLISSGGTFKEIQKLKLEAEIKIRQLEELSSKKLTDQIQKREILADNKIEQLIRDANLNIKNYISSIAVETTINILKNNLTVDKKTDLINESIKELNTTLKV